MPYKIEWSDADHLLYTELFDTVTIDELNTYFAELREHLNASFRPIEVILDVRNMISQALIPLDQFQGFGQLFDHENLGWTAIVGMQPSLAFTIKLLVKQFDFKYAGFDEKEEAAQFLKQVRILQDAAK